MESKLCKPNRKVRGQGLVEYALILVLVAVVVTAVLLLLGPTIGNVYQSVIDALGGSGAGSGSHLSSASASEGFGELKITVTVSTATTLTVSGSVGGSMSCSGTCQFTYSTGGYPSSGSATIKASDGSSKTVNW